MKNSLHYLLGLAGALALVTSAPAYAGVTALYGTSLESLTRADFSSQPTFTATKTYLSSSGVKASYTGLASGISSILVPGNKSWAPLLIGGDGFATGFTTLELADGTYFNNLTVDVFQNINSRPDLFPIELDFQVIDNHGVIILDGRLNDLLYRSYRTVAFIATDYDVISRINLRATFVSNPDVFLPESGFLGDGLGIDNVSILRRLQTDVDPPIIITPPELPGVPEPATWAMMILGFGLAGASIRRRRRAYA